MKISKQFFVCLLGLTTLYSCQQAGVNKTGSEFIPDMAHSTAYEANVLINYSFNTWDKESTFTRRELSQPRLPVKGTIPRGYTGVTARSYGNAEEIAAGNLTKVNAGQSVPYTPNSAVPYYYPDTEDGRNAAMREIRYNPFPITKEGLERGKELYTIYCAICHGEKADGAGYLVRDNGGKYPAQPANLIDTAFVNSSNGRFYHAIYYGKNAMGAHADKLSYEERWQVIHYIRSLQASALKKKYNEEINELKPEYGVPIAKLRQTAKNN